jgi:hypothetical protein
MNLTKRYADNTTKLMSAVRLVPVKFYHNLEKNNPKLTTETGITYIKKVLVTHLIRQINKVKEEANSRRNCTITLEDYIYSLATGYTATECICKLAGGNFDYFEDPEYTQALQEEIFVQLVCLLKTYHTTSLRYMKINSDGEGGHLIETEEDTA